MARKTIKTSRPKAPQGKKGIRGKIALKDLDVIGVDPKGGRKATPGGDAGKFDPKAKG